MREFLLLPKLKVKLFFKFFATLSRARVFVGFLFFLVALIFIGVEFVVFYSEFIFLKYQPIIGTPLTIHILNLAFLAFFSMLLLSNFISALPTLFRSKEVEFLLTTPLKHLAVFTSKFVDTTTYSSWASFILIPPVFVAFGLAYQAGLIYYPLGLFVVFPFIVIAASFGVLILLLITRYLLKLDFLKMLLILAPLLAAFIFYGVKQAIPEEAIVLRVTSLAALNRYLAGLNTSSPYFPSSWLINFLRMLLIKNSKEVIFNLFLLLSTALFALQLCFLFSRRNFYDAWSSAHDKGRTLKKIRQKTDKIVFKAPIVLKGQFGSLITKDIRNFLRDPAEWSQALFLLLLIIVYVFSLGKAPVVAYPTSSFWATIITFVNFGVTGYILTTFALRFIFPTVSLEGQSAWILYSSPMRISKLLWEKFIVGFIFLFVLSGALIVFSGGALRLDQPILYGYLASMGILVLSIVSLSLGFGAVFPNFKEKNPSSLSTSFGGIFTLILSLGYVAAVVLLIALPLKSYFEFKLEGVPFRDITIIQASLGIFVLSFLATVIPMYLGFKKVDNYDF